MGVVQVIGIGGLPVIKEEDDLAELICGAAEKQETPIRDGDIIVISHIVVSRAEGNTVNLDEVVPSDFAEAFAEKADKDAAVVETVLRECKRIVRMDDRHLITETKHGFVCANSGVDQSNVPGERTVALLPEDSDGSARRIKRKIGKLTGKKVAVVICDTHGRPLRMGQVNVALGVAGLQPIRDRRGESDLFGRVLRVKRTAVADELAAAAELVIGQADEGVPVAIIRGYKYPRSERATAKELIRPKDEDLFI